MNVLRLSLLTGTLSLALLACQSAPPTVRQAQQTKVVSLEMRSSATTVMSGGSVELAATLSGAGDVRWAIAAGGGSLSNDSGLSTIYTAPTLSASASPVSVTVTAAVEGGTTASVTILVTAPTVTVSPTPSSPPAPNPTGVEIVRLTDVRGMELPLVRERNINKAVDLFAAQYEDAICLTARVNDANRNAVAGAIVSVTAPTLVNSTIAIAPGCVAGATRTAAVSDPVTSNAQGIAHFTIFAPSPGLLGKVAGLIDGPMKFVVNAVGAGSQVAVEPLEFKMFYLNMSHLYYADGPNFGNRIATPQRWGATLNDARFNNIFQTRAQPGGSFANRNLHTFRTDTYRKQPQEGPFPIARTSPVAPGFMRYDLSTVSEVRDVNGVNVPAVVFATGCDTFTIGGRTFTSTSQVCYDADGSGVSISPAAVVDDRSLPVQATVQATFTLAQAYGADWYFFDLKSYIFTKTYLGSFATIAKTIDRPVLTWAGPDRRTEAENLKTLQATNAPAVTGASTDVFTASATLTVRNAGQAPIHNLTVRDALPAELGVITASDGVTVESGTFRGTYDRVNHVITWNRSNNMSLASLAPGASLQISFRVYARQKPGYCWSGGNVPDYDVLPIRPVSGGTCAYDDPYRVVNGRATDDVTVSYFFSADLNDRSNLVNQQVRDYTPDQNESDINVVRPLYLVRKTMVGPAILLKGGAGFFDLRISQIDRTTPGREYAALKALYPNEFAGGTGRKNPFGTGLRLHDRMSRGLDFTDSQPLSVTPGIGGAMSFPAIFPVGGDTKHMRFDIPLNQVFQASDVGTARITLNANLASVGAGGGAVNGALGGYWYNCAYLDANNLNQQLNDPNIYGSYPIGLRPPWTQYEGEQASIVPLLTPANGLRLVQPLAHLPTTDLPLDPSGGTSRSWIRSCERAQVVADQRLPLVGLSGRHEFTDLGSALAGPTDPYRVGQTFAYKYDALNVGTSAALDAVLRVDLPSAAVVSFSGSPRLYRSLDGGATFAPTTVTFAASGGTLVQTEQFDMAPGVVYRLVVPARAVSAGVQIDILGRLIVPGQTTRESLDDTTVTP